MNVPTTIPPVTIARPYTMTDVAMRFLSLIPDLGIIGVVGMLAHNRTIQGSETLLALLAILAGRLSPTNSLKIPSLPSAPGAGLALLILAVKKIFVVGAVLAGAHLLLACATWRTEAIGVAKITQCVLDHDTEPPAQIGLACGGLAIEEVIAILAAQQSAEAKHAAKRRAQSAHDSGVSEAGYIEREAGAF